MGLRLAADPFLAMLLGPERGQGRAWKACVGIDFPEDRPEGRGSRGACSWGRTRGAVEERRGKLRYVKTRGRMARNVKHSSKPRVGWPKNVKHSSKPMGGWPKT